MRAFETLEDRLPACVPADVLQIIQTVNAGQYTEQADINADGMVSPLDALLAINAANQRAATWRPSEMHPHPNGGGSSLDFSPCGENRTLLVMSLGIENPENARVTISGEEYMPVEIGMFGRFQTIEFEVWGSGHEFLRVFGDFEDDLLTVIIS